MVKIRVKHEFYDKENDLKLRSVGDTLTVSKDRAEYLVRMKIAEVIDSKGGDPESPIEAQGKRLIFMPEGLKLRGDTGLTTVYVRHT